MLGAARLTGPPPHLRGDEFRPGDRIVCLRNAAKFGVVNGSRATITRINPAARTIEAVDDGGVRLTLPAGYLDGGHVTHGYAITDPQGPRTQLRPHLHARNRGPLLGGTWEAMHGEMAGIEEVRHRQGGQLHRLFWLLDLEHPDGPALVMTNGDSKPNRTAMSESVSRRAREHRDAYHASRSVDFSER